MSGSLKLELLVALIPLPPPTPPFESFALPVNPGRWPESCYSLTGFHDPAAEHYMVLSSFIAFRCQPAVVTIPPLPHAI